MAGITGSMRSVRQLFRDDYAIGDFQRGYTWHHDHVATLVRDLARAYERRKDPDVSGEYYIGAIVTHNRFGYHHVIDGQQRLTTLLLLLVWLRHELAGAGGRRESVLESLVLHPLPGRETFAIDVSEREPVLRALFDDPATTARLSLDNDTDRNLVDRYMTIAEAFPDDLRTKRLPNFVDWLLDKVVAAKIDADKEADAYTIFETTNDRGQKLGSAELLKNYLQSQIEDLDERDEALSAWTRAMRDLQRFGPGGDLDFVIHWLQARHAEMPASKGRPSDLKLIAQDHFGWIKDNHVRLGLTGPHAHLRFMREEFDTVSTMYRRVRAAEEFPERGLDSLFFLSNLKIGWAQLARVVTLAGVDPDLSEAENAAKMRAAATFVEIFAARLIWQNFNTTSLANAKNREQLEEAAGALRNTSPAEATARLTAMAHELPLTFHARSDVGLARNAGSRARTIMHTMLARMSACLDEAFGATWAYPHYEIRSAARGYSIEHVLPNDPSGAKGLFESDAGYHKRRNRIGALLLIRAADNHRLADSDYLTKAHAYAEMTRLARTFHESFYSPNAETLLAQLGLTFKAYESFGPPEIEERQKAMARLAELTWSPDRIAFAARPEATERSEVYALPLDGMRQDAAE